MIKVVLTLLVLSALGVPINKTLQCCDGKGQNCSAQMIVPSSTALSQMCGTGNNKTIACCDSKGTCGKYHSVPLTTKFSQMCNPKP